MITWNSFGTEGGEFIILWFCGMYYYYIFSTLGFTCSLMTVGRGYEMLLHTKGVLDTKGVDFCDVYPC